MIKPMHLRDMLDTPASAIVLAEGEFGEPGGKTANGVVLHSEVFESVVIVDSTTAGRTPAEVLGRSDAPDVPIVESMINALDMAPAVDALVIGVAPAGGELPDAWIDDIERAIHAGCDIISGLHTFISEQDHWRELADEYDVRLFDIRKPPDESELRVGDGSVDKADADIVLILGTDCAVGKRMTTFELYQAARAAGYDAGWIATGQTGIMVGAHHGIVIDRVPADFTAGVLENLVLNAATDHDIVFVEGQASLTHRAYSGVTLSILHGTWPDTVVLAHNSGRKQRAHFEQFPVEGIESERGLIEELSEGTVAAISTWGEPETAIQQYDIPAVNVYDEEGPDRLLRAVEETLGKTRTTV